MVMSQVHQLKGVLLLFAAALIGATLPGFAAITATTAGKIDTVTLTSKGADGKLNYTSEALMFVPDVNVGDRATATPIILVYGDSHYTKETALKEARTSGIGEIAAQEEGVILFINSLGNDWSLIDRESLPAAIALYSDSTGKSYAGGKSKDGFLPGSRVRLYVFARGKGADFVVTHLVAGVPMKAMYTSDIVAQKPTSILLANVSANVVAANDGVEVPCYIVNGTQGIYDAFVKLNSLNAKVGRQTSKIKSSFDRAAVLAGYEKVVSTATRRNQTVCSVPQYEKLGIIQKQEFAPHFDKKIEYFSYIPESIKDSAKGAVPLVLLFHGAGNQAEFQAWWSGWPTIGKESGFMVVSVNRHNLVPASVAVELLDYLIGQYPMIDPSRVYASGFSMGAAKSWDLGNQYPLRFAGIVPTNGAFPPQENAEAKYVMPVFYVASESSHIAELPHQKSFLMGGNKPGEENGVDKTLARYFKRNGVTDSYKYDRSLNETWGIKPDYSYQVQSSQFSDVKITVNEFKSSDGNIYTALASNSNTFHEPIEQSIREAWKFIRQFSRNADGSIKITK
jgi:poly(3-hydroxybutyrate) depolymerase